MSVTNVVNRQLRLFKLIACASLLVVLSYACSLRAAMASGVDASSNLPSCPKVVSKDGDFIPKGWSTSSRFDANSVEADFNGDGKLDFAAVLTKDSEDNGLPVLVIYLNSGSGEYKLSAMTRGLLMTSTYNDIATVQLARSNLKMATW